MENSKKAIFTGFLLVLVWLVPAHEFWMQPDKFRYQKGDVMRVQFMVGEQFIGERWNMQGHRLVRLDHYTVDGLHSLLDRVVPADASYHLELPLSREGTHLLALQSTNAFIELGAEQFNAYLREDGLDDVIRHREKTGTLQAPAREHYQRNAKLLIQAGGKPDPISEKVTGLPFEIVPLSNPFTLPLGSEIKFLLLFEGKPLPYARVKVWNRREGRTFVQNIYTEKDGTLTARLGNTGMWMVSAVKMVPSSEPGVDWQSYWASLVFGI
jgi:uncharacterized GH25 family protein